MALQVAAIQHDIVWEDRTANLTRLASRVTKAAAAGASLIVLPEMFATGWSMNTERTAEEPNGPTFSWLEQQAAEHGVWIGGSVAIQVDGASRPSNQFILLSPDGAVARYDKRHLVTVFDIHTVGEHSRFASGTSPVIVEIDGIRFGLAICYDLRFGDLFWEMAEDVDAFLVVANWPAVRSQHWSTLLRARAIENQAYVVGVNRVGEGDGVAFAGDSGIIDPMGHVLANAGNAELTLVATIDQEVVSRSRKDFPFLADRGQG